MHRRISILLGVALIVSVLSAEGARYLIVTPDSFVDAAAPLARWKTSKGMLAKVVPTSVTGNDTAQIRDYVRYAYFNWAIRPEFVLLFGSPAAIPSQGGNNDCYYGDMIGDYLMEIPVGRLPALNVRECSTLVAKVLAYENPPATDTAWFIAGTTVVREDVPPDSLYQPDSRFLRQYWVANGYTVAESLINLMGHNSSHVTAAANAGRAFITYRGTGVGTWYPPFGAIDPYGWTNGARMPVVVGATCQTITLFPGESMYGDKFIRAGTPDDLGGAVAYFGTTRPASYVSRYRSACYRGFFKALYEEDVWQLGTATLRGRFRVDSLYRVQLRYTEWNLLGDPELNVWTGVPTRLTVTHDSAIPMAPGQFVVTVEAGGSALPGALVCISMDTAIYSYQATGANGRATFTIDPEHPGEMKVVVTGRNLRPYVGTCGVILTDVACTGVPGSTVVMDSGVVNTPACHVYNEGNRAADYRVKIRLGDAYQDSAVVTGHLPGTERTVSFREWTPTVRGSFDLSCTTMLVSDQRTANDRFVGSVFVRVRDVGAVAVKSPVGVLVAGSVVSPAAVWQNPGNIPATFRAWMLFDDPGGERVISRRVDVVNLPAGADTTVDQFAPCTLAVAGRWTVRCSTYFPYDARADNDVVLTHCVVASSWQPGWGALAAVPLAPSGKLVKNGAWLAYNAGDGLVYAAKGNKQGDFYSYDPVADAWTQRLSWPAGREAKGPYKGAAAVSDGAGKVYATKGNNTQGFWLYDAVLNTWTQKANVPLGPTNKKVKGGTDLAYYDGLVYLLKGYKDEFWRYNPASDSWYQLPNAPTGINGKWNVGSWMTGDGAGKLYAHKSKYHEFYAFDIAASAWGPALIPMPLASYTGKSRKSKDGGAGAYADGAIYAFKGGNTQEFWKYDVAGNAWTEKETIPQVVPSSAKKRKVKAGADILWSAPGALLALKGGMTNELWRYVAEPDVFRERPADDGVAGHACPGSRAAALSVRPSMSADRRAFVSYRRTQGGAATLSVRDMLGRTVLTRQLNAREGTVALDMRDCGAGAYFVELREQSSATVCKVVVR